MAIIHSAGLTVGPDSTVRETLVKLLSSDIYLVHSYCNRLVSYGPFWKMDGSNLKPTLLARALGTYVHMNGCTYALAQRRAAQ